VGGGGGWRGTGERESSSGVPTGRLSALETWRGKIKGVAQTQKPI
jgi:hypothetical protein